jgi:uncharacterized protein DUF4157
MERHTANVPQSDQQPAKPAAPLHAHPLTQIRRALGTRAGGRFIQAKLTVSQPGDQYEQEADRVADQIMRMPDPASPAVARPEGSPQISGLQRKCAQCEEEQIQRQPMDEKKEEEEALPLQAKEAAGQTLQVTPAVQAQADGMRGGGQPLPESTRAFFEPRFGHDFSQVRIHTDTQAAESARDVDALAYTVGNHVVFGAGQYAPRTGEGRRLLAHELTHVIQQRSAGTATEKLLVDATLKAEQEARHVDATLFSEGEKASKQSVAVEQSATSHIQRSGSPRYSTTERQDQLEGRVTGAQEDVALATQFAFQPGDIVFRLGSSALGIISHNPVTHGGIYIGNGLVHDMVGFGNRTVRTSLFYQEAADPSVVKVIRFTGPLNTLIIQRLLSNIQRRDFRLPSDPQPWNLFSSADDYRTATCLEYSQAQFLYAIRQLSVDQSVSQSDRDLIRQSYFTGGAAEPNPLVQPQEISVTGLQGGGGLTAPGLGVASTPIRAPSAMLQVEGMIKAADYQADDVDPTVFSNRFEGQHQTYYPDGLIAQLAYGPGPTHDTATLRTFTYRSFADSRQFFTVIR